MALKRLFSLATAALCMATSQAQTPVNPNATQEAKDLLSFIYAQRGNGTLVGQHSYPLTSDMYMEYAANDFGQHPAIFGQDFGYSAPNTKDGINFRQRSIDNAIKWHEKGAIITLMWHAVPPTTDAIYTTWQGENGIQSKLSDQQWADLLTDGTEINTRWKEQVDVIAFFLKQLQDANVPVIWRPYHEMNGDWFWWGYREGDKGYRALYRMLYDRLVNHHHLNNLLWVFNANELGSSNVKPYADFYPGKEYVDILATDIYSSKYNVLNYDELRKVADGKPIAWGECGMMPTPEICREQPEWVWFMTWAEWFDTANDYNRRKAIYEAEETITLEELNASKKK